MKSAIRPFVAVLAALLALGLPRPARAVNLADTFPEMRGRQHQLGRTMILTDVILVDDIGGKVEKVKLGRSWDLAQFASRTVVDSLARRGYAVDSVLVASIGVVLGGAPFQSDSVAASGPDDAEHIIRTPFYQDPLFASPEAYAEWRNFLNAGWAYGRKKGKPPGYLPAAIPLGARLGCETVGFFVAGSWGIPTTKKLLLGLGGMSQSSNTVSHFVLADARTGEVLWKAASSQAKSADEDILERMIRLATEDLP